MTCRCQNVDTNVPYDDTGDVDVDYDGYAYNAYRGVGGDVVCDTDGDGDQDIFYFSCNILRYQVRIMCRIVCSGIQLAT